MNINAAWLIWNATAALAIAGWGIFALIWACNAWTNPERNIRIMLRVSHWIEGQAIAWRGALAARAKFEAETEKALADALNPKIQAWARPAREEA